MGLKVYSGMPERKKKYPEYGRHRHVSPNLTEDQEESVDSSL